MSALPSVYNTNTKSGKRRPKPSAKPRHQHPPTKAEPSPYSTTINNKSQRSEPPKPQQPDDEYPKVVPKTTLDQLLSTLGNALQLGSTLNRGNWVVPTASNKTPTNLK